MSTPWISSWSTRTCPPVRWLVPLVIAFPCWTSESGARRSASHETRTPQVERALLVRPGAPRDLVRHDLELGRDFDEIALRVLDHEEEVVARSMPPRSPPQLDAAARHDIGPV